MKKIFNKTKQWLAKVFVYNFFGKFSPLFLGAGALLFLINPIAATITLAVGVGLAATSIAQNIIIDHKVKKQDEKMIIEDYVPENIEEEKTQIVTKDSMACSKGKSRNTDGVER